MAEPTGPGSSEAARFQFPDGIAPGFAIEGVIGRGAHGIVYRAVQVNLGRPVALKVLRDDALSERSIRDRFLQEARIAASLNHPNIVPVLDHGISQGFAYIAFPLIEGTSLRKFIGKDGVPWAQASSYVHGIATALAYVHSLGIVHRDLKPENVLVNTAGQVVVTDFGISKPQRSALHTEAGVILGTAGYLSPEQIVGGTGSSQSDIYAFGVLIWELLVGCRPFERVDPRDPTSRRAPVAEIASCTRQELPPLATLVPDLNVDLVRFVERMISVDPACRPQTMAEVQQMLVALSGVPELDASGKPIVSPAVRRSRALSMPVAQVTGKLSAASAGGRSAASAGGPRTAVESKSRLVNAAAVLAFLSLPLVLAI
jgi:serine/threonine protein kinase